MPKKNYLSPQESPLLKTIDADEKEPRLDLTEMRLAQNPVQPTLKERNEGRDQGQLPFGCEVFSSPTPLEKLPEDPLDSILPKSLNVIQAKRRKVEFDNGKSNEPQSWDSSDCDGDNFPFILTDPKSTNMASPYSRGLQKASTHETSPECGSNEPLRLQNDELDFFLIAPREVGGMVTPVPFKPLRERRPEYLPTTIDPIKDDKDTKKVSFKNKEKDMVAMPKGNEEYVHLSRGDDAFQASSPPTFATTP